MAAAISTSAVSAASLPASRPPVATTSLAAVRMLSSAAFTALAQPITSMTMTMAWSAPWKRGMSSGMSKGAASEGTAACTAASGDLV